MFLKLDLFGPNCVFQLSSFLHLRPIKMHSFAVLQFCSLIGRTGEKLKSWLAGKLEMASALVSCFVYGMHIFLSDPACKQHVWIQLIATYSSVSHFDFDLFFSCIDPGSNFLRKHAVMVPIAWPQTIETWCQKHNTVDSFWSALGHNGRYL